MTAGQVIAVVALLAQMYQAPAPLMECMSWHESRHDVMAINGDYEGVFQLGSEFWEEVVPLYLADERAARRGAAPNHRRRE